ncbi:FecR family protein [Pedobacter metabolipauper]|uniref:FecR family protein n=1 Tax=Pedobacter metabolipauper TaxID=425513 RepID=A0A4R6STY6_9SPHI|nr:FecR family protein [Pedobacter metabolipauper]TDQ08478.1 FecR family protein [Pedobacter metabolipauper]
MKDLNPNSLLQKLQSGQLNPEEHAMVEGYFIYDKEPLVGLSEEELSLGAREIVEHVKDKALRKSPTRLWAKLAIAASALITIGIAAYFFEYTPGRKNEAITVFQNDVNPGGNHATLTLANGKKINLSNAKNGILAREDGIEITKSANGINYKITNTGSKSGNIEYNTIETPRGGQFHIDLPDGTQVELNAATLLKLPTTFAYSNVRKVEILSGEAYFEVTKDAKHPFIVKTKTQEIQVLGTHFNVSAYSDEPLTKTTLLEGSVRVVPVSPIAGVAAKTGAQILSPGQQSLNGDGLITVSNVNVQNAVAWKNGYMVLSEGSLRDVMTVISRWYDVDVVYECNPDLIEIGGRIRRSAKLSRVLKLLGKTGSVHFKVEGRRVTVIE